MKKARYTTFIVFLTFLAFHSAAQKKAVFIILDGIPADVLEKTETPVLDAIAMKGGYTRAWIGGEKGRYSESPTISAVGYNHLLTGTWTNKHNVWGNAIKEPNYHYWNIFRIVENAKKDFHTAVFSTWRDNRTKLIGEALEEAGNIRLDYAFDGFEHDEQDFPHDSARLFIFNIDEHVSKEAGRYISEKGPDLSWVYLEYTDDMGHQYGDSPQLTDAVRKADNQVGRIWDAINERTQKFQEDWIIVITTDHGRDAKTGKGHGGQTDRERAIWIVTNQEILNDRFKQNPAMVDIMPSILRFMDIDMPVDLKTEVDGVPFVGEVSISNLKGEKLNDMIHLTWDVLDPKGMAEVWITTTNHFKDGAKDEYQLVGTAKVSEGQFNFYEYSKEKFIKVLVKAPNNWVNYWIVENTP